MNNKKIISNEIIEQLEKCNFTCIAGPLINNTSFIKLKELSDINLISSLEESKKTTEDKLKEIVIYAYKEYDIKTLEFLVKLFTKRYESAKELENMIKDIAN